MIRDEIMGQDKMQADLWSNILTGKIKCALGKYMSAPCYIMYHYSGGTTVA
jgi:hypothetical protein